MQIERRNYWLLAVGGVAGCAAIAYFVGTQTLAGSGSGSSFIEELHGGSIARSDIKSIEVLKFDPGAGWPMTETEYALKARKSLGRPAIGELLRILNEHTTSGRRHRNHPTTLYYGILRIDTMDGRHYYVFYDLEFHDGEYYVAMSANFRGSTNPNHAVAYENSELAEYLKENDPWYRDLDSPPAQHRPGFPDNLP